MQLEEVAKALKELGHPTRLFIFKHLVKAGEQGLPVSCKSSLGYPALHSVTIFQHWYR
mgnify:CR=1 FL=1